MNVTPTVKSDAVTRFMGFFHDFQETTLWKDMEKTVENSPWHREANVSVHTKMLLRWYFENLASKRSDTQRMLTLVSCLFHDVGKPPAEVLKFSEERGEYRAYHGHEQLSARLWVDFAMSNWEMVSNTLRFTLDDVSNVAFMVEHHVPFSMVKPHKKQALKTSLLWRMGEDGHQAWLDFLLSDQHGRNSDDQAAKLARVEVWMSEWEKV